MTETFLLPLELRGRENLHEEIHLLVERVKEMQRGVLMALLREMTQVLMLGSTSAVLPMTFAPVAHSKAALSNFFPRAINPL